MSGNECLSVGGTPGRCCGGVNIGIVGWGGGGGSGGSGSGGGGDSDCCENLRRVFEAFLSWYMGIGGLLKPPVETFDDLGKKYPKPEKGWTALVLDEGTFYVWTGNEWRNVGSPNNPPLAGPQGPIGPQGPQGPQGEPGPQGIPGVAGAVPDPGDLPGPSDTLKPGTVMYVISEGKFYVWTGTEWKQTEVTATVPGPQGEQGPTGPGGPAGPAGPQGPIGPAGPGGSGDVSALVEEVQKLREIVNALSPRVDKNDEMIHKLAQMKRWGTSSRPFKETKNLVPGWDNDMYGAIDAAELNSL